MLYEKSPGTHEMTFAFTGLLMGFFVKLLLEYYLSSIHVFNPEILYLIYLFGFVLISTCFLKKFIIPSYVYPYKLFYLLNIGNNKRKIDNDLEEKDLNILVPSITVSLIIFDLWIFIKTLTDDIIISLLSVIFFATLLFFISYKESKNVRPFSY